MSCRVLLTRRLGPSPSISSNYLPKKPSSLAFSVQHRQFSTPPSSHTKELAEPASEFVYNGPLASTFRRLKFFSLSSLTLSCTLAPFMFLMESNLPTAARLAVASIAVGTSGISTGLVGWCGKPYVAELRRLVPETASGVEGIEMTTFDIFLRPRITRIYDAAFLIDTKRPFAKWELAEKVTLSDSKSLVPNSEETVAETTDKDGRIIGRWVVKWGENGEGICHEVGSIVRHFNIHEELLP